MSQISEVSFWRGTLEQYNGIPASDISPNRIYLVFGANGLNGIFLGKYLAASRTDVMSDWNSAAVHNTMSATSVRDRFSTVEELFNGLPNNPAYQFDIIKTWVRENALSKEAEETLSHLFTCLLGINIGNYSTGISGANINQYGDAEFNNVSFRGVPKGQAFAENNISFANGETWFNEGGTVEKIESIGNRVYKLYPVLNVGETILQRENDLCIGELHNASGLSVKSYFKVLSVDNSSKNISVELVIDSETPATNNPISVGMKYVRVGNTANPIRQDSSYFSCKDGNYRYLKGVTSFKINNDKVRIQLGGISDTFLSDELKDQLKNSDAYIESLVVRDIVRVTDAGEVVLTPIDRGPWIKGVTYKLKDEVDHIGCIWQCKSNTTTLEEPGTFALDWRMRVGDPNFYMNIESSNGTEFFNTLIDTTLTCYVLRGSEDVSKNIAQSDWVWERESGDAEGDSLWNQSHRNIGNACRIKYEDLGNIVVNRYCKFIITAYIRKENNLIETLKRTIEI